MAGETDSSQRQEGQEDREMKKRDRHNKSMNRLMQTDTIDFFCNDATVASGLWSMKTNPDGATGSVILHCSRGFTVASQIPWQHRLGAIIAVQWKIGHRQALT